MYPMFIPDDATEGELQEIAAEQRALASIPEEARMMVALVAMWLETASRNELLMLVMAMGDASDDARYTAFRHVVSKIASLPA